MEEGRSKQASKQANIQGHFSISKLLDSLHIVLIHSEPPREEVNLSKMDTTAEFIMSPMLSIFRGFILYVFSVATTGIILI